MEVADRLHHGQLGHNLRGEGRRVSSWHVLRMLLEAFKKRCDCLSLPCPFSLLKLHSCVDCAAEPGTPSPGVFLFFGLLLASADLQEK